MFLNRLKIFLLLFVLLFLSVLFWQNREPLSLKLLCPDINQSCLYQTPKLPLAIWMLVFTLAGIFTSLTWQLLNYLSIRSSINKSSSSSTSYFSEVEDGSRSPQKRNKVVDVPRLNKDRPPIARSPVATKTTVNPPVANNSTSQSDWENDNRDDDWNTGESTQSKIPAQPTNKQLKDNQNYEVQREPQRVQRSGSTYSYKYREANDSKSEKVDQIYDANYKIINPPLHQTDNENIETKEGEDDEDWI